MRALTHAARIGIKDKRSVKHWIQRPKNSVMHNPIANRRFMDMAHLWINNEK